VKKQNNTEVYYTPIQLKFPLGLEKIIKIDDAVYSFSEVMEHIDLQKYFVEEKGHEMGRPRYDREKLLKIVLFAFMEFGYCSVRFIQKLCETDIRFIWMLDGENAPSHTKINDFIKYELSASLDKIFDDINGYIFTQQSVDTNHVYIDGTKIEANANKYTWVWKKSCIKSRNNVFGKLSMLLAEMNEVMAVYRRAVFETRQEYAIEYVEYILSTFLDAVGMTEADFVHGKGKRKTSFQQLYEKVKECYKKLKEYAYKISVCGKERNSYSKTDKDATFMRFKKDHMNNDQLLPGYNLQMVVCDEFIAHYGVYAFASDMDCFQPLMEGFSKRYGFYPKYPVADAGYGSFNNYLYCEQHGMEKYMKFTMYEKETKDSRYRDNPYRACNFAIDHEGYMVCPNGKRFHFLRSAPVKGNQFGRTEEYYRCEDCTGCPHRERCHKSKDNRVVRINEELTQFHNEVLDNLNCVHGALLRMNRSIQAEGAFGGIKWNKGYKRLRRRGIEGVILELGLISCGFNLHKYHLKKMFAQKAA
jgi:transposase